MAVSPQPRMIAETYHSTLETCLYEGKVVVIKRSRNVHDPRTKERWRNEVEALKIVGTTHQNITSLLTSNATSLTLTLRLEPGASLDTFIDNQFRCTLASTTTTSTPADASLLHRQITSALSHVHARRLVHDDVKPENIIWDPSQKRAVLIDFGAALDFRGDDSTHPSFNPSGTPSYAPPEFLHKRKSSSGKGDIWALGVTMLFVWGHVRLPDGAWLLPGVWDEPSSSRGGDREQMLAWLRQVRVLRDGYAGDERPELRMMLVDEPDDRIGSADLLERLLSEVSLG